MKPRTLTVCVVALLLSLTVLAYAAGPNAPPRPRAQFVPLGFGGDHFWWTTASAVSDNGNVVVGIGGRAEDGYLEAWRWTPADGIEGLGDLPGWDGGTDYAFESSAHGVAGNGTVVVGTGRSNNGDEAFRWTPHEGLVALGALPGPQVNSFGAAANRNGQVIVGSSASIMGWQAFRWTARRGMQPLGTLGGPIIESHGYAVSADGNVVVGLSASATGWEAFRWTPRGGMEGLGQLGASTWTEAAAVSADGDTVVGYARTGSRFEAFRWQRGTGMEGLGDLPGGNTISMAFGVSGDGKVVVGASETSNPYGMGDAFIWDKTNGMRLLQAVLTDEYRVDLAGWKLTQAYAISPDGRSIVGHGTNPDGENEAWLVRLPPAPKPQDPKDSPPNDAPGNGNTKK
jgi:probable HAF family extracellular repeat protein